ncbi:MAG: hypothetical protein ACPG4N_04375 [Gammaproteobacteria bacterium]
MMKANQLIIFGRVVLTMAFIGMVNVAAAPVMAECGKDHLQFDFANISDREAFAIFANFAKLKPMIDESVTGSGSLKFGCTHWRKAAYRLAREHELTLIIRNGTLRVYK